VNGIASWLKSVEPLTDQDWDLLSRWGARFGDAIEGELLTVVLVGRLQRMLSHSSVECCKSLVVDGRPGPHTSEAARTCFWSGEERAILKGLGVEL
jgi:hypothetical protein